MFGETTHTDPLPYLALHDKTWDQLVADIAAATAIVPFPDLPAQETQPDDGFVREGAVGAGVREIQGLLEAKGFDPGAIDGIFGPQMVAAVMAFQRANDLAADGIVGRQTLAKLRS
jgi:peptidoglycan hydrolase-like protein with peptidoglycan-binding domain